MRETGGDLDSLLSLLNDFDLESAWGELRVEAAVAELTMSTPAPSVNFTKGGSSDSVPETALNRIDPLTRVLEAPNDLWDIIWIPVAQTQLAITVILTNSIDQTLSTDEEAEVVAATDPVDHNFLVEWHLHRNTVLLTGFDEWPSEGETIISGGECQVATCSDRAHFKTLLCKKVKFCWLVHVGVVTEAELTFLVATPGDQLLRVSDQNQITILHS